MKNGAISRKRRHRSVELCLLGLCLDADRLAAYQWFSMSEVKPIYAE
jgi:hypothetical protein